MTYKFDDEEDLGKAVQSVKPFCKLYKQMKDVTEKYIVGDYADFDKYPGLAGKKWSRLCGFTFKDLDGKYFQFVFVPKLKGTLSRNQKALSGWYCWTLFSPSEDLKRVTSISEMKRDFGFNVNKFVHSDYFDKCLSSFKENISYVLDHQVKELLEQPQISFEDYKELARYVNAIKDSLQKMDEVKQYVTADNAYDDSGAPEYAKGAAPKIGHAKIAYNADKTYNLPNVPKSSRKDELKKRAIEKFLDKVNSQDDVD